MIPVFTFTITKKDINNRSRGQFTVFYMRTKNEISTTKNFKGGIIRGIPIQLLEKRKT
jgi:homoserine trans-succinylase